MVPWGPSANKAFVIFFDAACCAHGAPTIGGENKWSVEKVQRVQSIIAPVPSKKTGTFLSVFPGTPGYSRGSRREKFAQKCECSEKSRVTYRK